jgi:Tfp pilus assembly PilM family ATPase
MKNKRRPKAKKTSVALQVSAGYVKLCEASFYQKSPVCRLISRPLSSKNDDEISGEIKELFDKFNIRRRRVLLNIPRSLVMARLVSLPSTNDAEIKNMVKMESLKQVPYSGDEIITGFRITEKLKNGYSNVLMALAQSDIINRFINILKGAGLSVEKIALGSESLFGWFSMSEKRIIKEEKSENIALINVDSEYTEMDILENGNLVFTRSFSYAGKHYPYTKEIIDEIQKSIVVCQRERNIGVDKIFISGADARTKEIEPILKENINLPLEVMPQAQHVELDENIEGDLNTTSFIELIGLSSREESIKINLLPEKLQEEKEFRLLKKHLARALILFACIILISTGLIAKKLFDKARYLALLERRIKAVEPMVNKATRMKEDIGIIKRQIRKKPLAIDVLAEIYKVTPGSISFYLIDYESNKSLTLKGSAPSLSVIIEFIHALEDSKHFENIKLKYTAKRKLRGKQITEFEIKCLPVI